MVFSFKNYPFEFRNGFADILFFYRYNIEVVGYSSDADTRLLSSMKSKVRFNDFKLRLEKKVLCVQDHVHNGTKARNRLLKPSVILPIGSQQASVGHLKILRNSVSKDVHRLTAKDICPDDRQNYKSVENIMCERVRNALLDHVIDSEATVMYLQICHEITSAYNEFDLKPVERIYRIWHSVFFLRAWRHWLRSSPKYTVEKNFITESCYACIEINAQTLLDLIVKFREENLPEQFLPYLFSSQPCESKFRRTRSNTTLCWTKINYTMYDLLNVLRRIEAETELAYFKLQEYDISIPQSGNKPKKMVTYELPSNEEIEQRINDALNDGISDARKFGINVTPDDVSSCTIKVIQPKRSAKKLVENTPIPNESFNGSNMESDEDQMNDQKGEELTKSRLVWLLTESNQTLSNDRLVRVQKRSESKKQSFKSAETKKSFEKNETLRIGDWCLFSLNDENLAGEFGLENVIVGCILGFQYADGKNEREKRYSNDFVTLTKTDPREVNVLSSWYHVCDGKFTYSIEPNNFFTKTEKYIATVSPPTRINGGLSFSSDEWEAIEKELLR